MSPSSARDKEVDKRGSSAVIVLMLFSKGLQRICSVSKSCIATYLYNAVSWVVLYCLNRERKADVAGKQSVGMTVRLD